MYRTIERFGHHLRPQITLRATAAETNEREVVADERFDRGPQPTEVDGDAFHHGAHEVSAIMVQRESRRTRPGHRHWVVVRSSRAATA